MNNNSLWSLPAHWIIAAPVALVDDESSRYLQSLLSVEEIEQAKRFKKTSDCKRYLLSHGLKRFCLAHFLSMDPVDLTFSIGDKGKPFSEDSNVFDFNISHGGDWILFGLSSLGNIGVDVEESSRELSASIANYALSDEQLLSLKSDANPKQRLMLYWTQKEAISKALGLGLTIGFNTVDCNGRMGSSEVEHSGSLLSLHSQIIDQHVISCASSFLSQPELYQLSQWNKNVFKISTYKSMLKT